MDIIGLFLVLCVSGYIIIVALGSLVTKQYNMICDYKTLCHNIVLWGIDNVPPYKGVDKLNVMVLDKNKNKMANYYPHKRKIEIYMNSHYTVNEIVNTLLHEITHYKQHQTKPRTILKDYKKLLDVYGYENHPMEKEANENAVKYTEPCLKYLVKKKFIV